MIWMAQVFIMSATTMLCIWCDVRIMNNDDDMLHKLWVVKYDLKCGWERVKHRVLWDLQMTKSARAEMNAASLSDQL
jgi:hypothetical protein